VEEWTRGRCAVTGGVGLRLRPEVTFSSHRHVTHSGTSARVSHAQPEYRTAAYIWGHPKIRLGLAGRLLETI